MREGSFHVESPYLAIVQNRSHPYIRRRLQEPPRGQPARNSHRGRSGGCMDFANAWDLLVRKVTGWGRDFILLLPNLGVAILVLVGFWLLAQMVRSLLRRLLARVSHSLEVNKLVAQTVY